MAVDRFHRVDERLFRGAQPSEAGLKSLRDAGVRTVISLRDDRDLGFDERRVVESLGMRFVSVPVQDGSFFTQSRRIPDEAIRAFFDAVDAAEPGPIFVHCRRGTDRTGAIVAFYRIARQGWDSQRAAKEARDVGMRPWYRGLQQQIKEFTAESSPDPSRRPVVTAALRRDRRVEVRQPGAPASTSSSTNHLPPPIGRDTRPRDLSEILLPAMADRYPLRKQGLARCCLFIPAFRPDAGVVHGDERWRGRSAPSPRPTPAAATPAAADRHCVNAGRTCSRAVFPGRSGQIFVVPREGEVITERDPLYMFMHGSPWEYDTHIPVLFYGAPFVRQGQWRDAVSQQDIAPTLGALLGAPAPPTVTGRVLPNVLAASAGRPRIIVVLVLDAMRADYFDRFADVMPTLSRMRREGAWFSEARVNSLPTVTGVGHATIGTGSDPRFHGITVNNLFNTVTGKAQPAYDALDPRELMALTLADTWNIITGGRAVIIGQGGAIRATAGLVGHGACLINGRKVIAASYASNAGWETNPACYTMSDALKSFNGRTVWEAAGGTVDGPRHRERDASSARRACSRNSRPRRCWRC